MYDEEDDFEDAVDYDQPRDFTEVKPRSNSTGRRDTNLTSNKRLSKMISTEIEGDLV